MNVGICDTMVSLTAAVAMLLRRCLCSGASPIGSGDMDTRAGRIGSLSGFALGGDPTHFTEVVVRIRGVLKS